MNPVYRLVYEAFINFVIGLHILIVLLSFLMKLPDLRVCLPPAH